MTSIKTDNSLAADEARSAAVAKTENRVPLPKINDEIASETYITLGDLLRAQGKMASPTQDAFTICALTFKNGFVILGDSAPADPANFDAETGQTFARSKAIRAAWQLLGFRLRDQLAAKGA